MVIRKRGEVTGLTEQIDLTVSFKDTSGTAIDTDSFPKISIVQPSGLLLLAPTSVGVTRLDVGKYSYIHTVGINGPLGIYNDTWAGFIQGFRVESTFSFIVNETQLPGINSDGFLNLGDDPGFNYSQIAIGNINKLLKSLKARLNSSGKAKSTDGYGNVIYVDCDIFSVDTLVTFLATILWEFNSIPFFTHFTFDDIAFVEQFGEVLVQGATIYALASKALITRGSEYTITDNGINFNPPAMSDLMSTQYSTELTNYWEKLKMIKASLRPNPIGLGVFSMTGNANPAIRRLRHLKERKLI